MLIKFAARVDLHLLGEFLRGRSADIPHEAIQILDVALRELPTQRLLFPHRNWLLLRYIPIS